ncbi:hypothetical protein B296_00015564, partial [Ensete ventricosum]
MSGIRRLGALAARSLARRVFAPPHMHHRSFGAAALAEVEYWTEWEEDEERGRYAAAAATDACGEREPRRVQWVFMGSPGVQRHVYATRVAELLDVPYISMGSLVRQELNPSSSLYKKRVISSFSGNSCHCVALGFLELSVTKHLRTEGVEEEEIKARVSRPGWDPPLGSPRSTIPRPTGVRAAAYAPAVLGAAALAEVEYWTGWQEDPAAAAAATAPLAIRKDHFDHSFIGFASAILLPLHEGLLSFVALAQWLAALLCCVQGCHPPLAALALWLAAPLCHARGQPPSLTSLREGWPKVFRFELQHPIRVVRIGPTGYRYVDLPLPGGTVEIGVSPHRDEATPRLLARDEVKLDEAPPPSPHETRRRLLSPCRNEATPRLPAGEARENEVSPRSVAV